MSHPFKKPFVRNALGPRGRGKWRKTAPSASHQTQLEVPLGDVVRILCPLSKSVSVVGDGGGIISMISQESGAKIRLEEIVPGCDERVIVVSGSDKDLQVSKEHAKDRVTEDHGENARVENDKGEDGLKSEKATSCVQKALLLIFERIIVDKAEGNNGGEANKDSTVSVKLFVLSSQVSGLLGKGGNLIKQMTSDSGAQIKVLPKDNHHPCASSCDGVVQITGAVVSARKAITLVSEHLLGNPPYPVPAIKPPPSHSFAPFSRPEAFFPPQGPPSKKHLDTPEIPPFPKFSENFGHSQIQDPEEQLTFRLLCSSDRVGSVIGRGGGIVKSVEQATGCNIKVFETTSETDDRIIVISSSVLSLDTMSPAEEGILQVQHRIAMAVPDGIANVVSRLLVPSYLIGCLLGKGGAVISEMRRLSAAHICILDRDQMPISVPENDEVVQVTGELRAVQDTLLRITAKLKERLFADRIPAMNHARHPIFHQMPPFDPYMGRREPSPPRMFPDLPPFHREIVAPHYEERPGYDHAVHSFGHPPQVFGKLPSVPWVPKHMREGGCGGVMPLPDYIGGGPSRRIGGFTGGNNRAVITKTTVEVVVPRSLVPSLCGEDGYFLKRFLEISEALITITEPRPEAAETVIIISGTPEQTHAAQSLIQAFVLTETGAA